MNFLWLFEDASPPTILYHLTAKPRFKLDAKFMPNNNYLSWDYPDEPGIYSH